MRYYAIHSNGYSGSGPWTPAFELEADSPTSRPTSVKALQNKYIVEDAELSLKENDHFDAIDLVIVTAPQHVGYLAQVDDGIVVGNSRGPVDGEEARTWYQLNIPDDSPDPEGELEELQEEWENDLEAIRARDGELEPEEDELV